MGVDSATNSNDFAALLGELTSEQEGNMKKNAPIGGPDLSHYQSSSSSGHSSPEHDDAGDGDARGPQGGFRVDDLEMWEVLEALEMPGIPSASHDELLPNDPRSSPDSSAMSSRGLNAACLSPLSDYKSAKSSGVKRPAPTTLRPPTAAEMDITALMNVNAGSDSGDDNDLGDLSGLGGDATEEKRLKRMRRNRESAAMSRNRKKAYIDELETKVTSLASTVQHLQSENRALQQECHALKTQCATVAGVNLLALPGDDEVDSFVEQTSVASGSRSNVLHASRKLGTASLALASTLALVTLSVTSSDVFGAGEQRILHSPTSRVLMSFTGEEPGLEPLWPALNVARDMHPAAGLLPSPEAVAGTMPASAKLQPVDSNRVIHLPPNSSWQDALRTEKAVQRISSSFDAMDHSQRLGHGENSPDHHVYEPNWREEEDAFSHMGAFVSSEAQRFVFCSRAYAFDVAQHNRSSASARQPQSRELQIPAAMPARFRHAASLASGMPQLTDGSVGSNASDLPEPLPAQHLPIVSLLLPSAALRGVIQASRMANSAESMDSKGEPLDEEPLDTELMQVQCQVLKASRFGGV